MAPVPPHRCGTFGGCLRLALWLTVGWAGLCQFAVAHAATSNLALTSSDQHLVAAFNWNKAKALSWVRTGVQPDYIPCYWAGYNYRPAFYV